MPVPSTPAGPDQHQGHSTADPRDHTVAADRVPGRAAPLIDPEVLRDMERDFSDPRVVVRFVDDFSTTVMGKIDRVEELIAAGNALGAGEAVLSVTTSAAMVGAPRLTQAATATRRFIEGEDLSGARRSIALLRGCAADTVHELRAGRTAHG